LSIGSGRKHCPAIFLAKANLSVPVLVKRIVKGDKLGEFEEFALLAVHALKDGTYSVPIQQYMEKYTGRLVTMGAVYAALTRLEDKSYVRSVLGDATPVRGGKRKRQYQATAAGIKALHELKRVRERIWRAIESPGRA
jgi:PadR family transcriptional regulator PadR